MIEKLRSMNKELMAKNKVLTAENKDLKKKPEDTASNVPNSIPEAMEVGQDDPKEDEGNVPPQKPRAGLLARSTSPTSAALNSLVNKRLLKVSQTNDPETAFGTARSMLSASKFSGKNKNKEKIERMRVNNRESNAGNTPLKSPLPRQFDVVHLGDGEVNITIGHKKTLKELLAEMNKSKEAGEGGEKDKNDEKSEENDANKDIPEENDDNKASSEEAKENDDKK